MDKVTIYIENGIAVRYQVEENIPFFGNSNVEFGMNPDGTYWKDRWGSFRVRKKKVPIDESELSLRAANILGKDREVLEERFSGATFKEIV
tara:strand:- start:5739 stop:6011 length:273 start_codon:yes stop_codon:yes gene_type:complete